LGSAPLFEAITYTWGGEQPSLPIVISGKPFTVTPTVHEILSYRQSCISEPLFCIDAICIDQLNIPERNKQVTLMRDI
jgi:hypothetical protein